MSFLRTTQAPTKLNSVKITQSCLGLPYPTVLGRGRVQQSLLWQGPLQSANAPSGSKGGGKGGSSYIYSADTIVGLCNGPVLYINDVWSNQTWLSNDGTTESFTVGGSGVYTPVQASNFSSDAGVSVANEYNDTFNDYLAPGSNTLAGTDTSSLVQVPFGATLQMGEYSISTETIGMFALTSCSNASGGIGTGINTTYQGSGWPAGTNNLQGYTFEITEFTNAGNNGIFVCVSNTSTELVLANGSGVAETNTGSAAELGVTYHFSAADIAAGTQVNISYSFNLPYIQAQETDIIPASRTLNVGQPWWYGKDEGVIYYSSGDIFNPLNGLALTPTSTNPPTQTGTYFFVSSGKSDNGNTYTFAPGDIGQEVLITYQYQDEQPYTNTGIPSVINFQLFTGQKGQAPWSLLTSSFPGQAIGYSSVAYTAFDPMTMGSAAQIQDNLFEVQTADAFGGGVVDCNPIQCITQVLTNTIWGLGSGDTPFPVEVLDNGPNGSWGYAAQYGTIIATGNTNPTVAAQTSSDWHNLPALINPAGHIGYVGFTEGGGTAYVNNFGFAVPASATITGVEVLWIGSGFDSHGGGVPTVIDVSLETTPGMAAATKTVSQAAGVPDVYGSSNLAGSAEDQWGLTLTPAQVNASTFGVGFQAGPGAAFGSDVWNVQVNVYYTMSAGGRTINSTAWNWFAANSYFITSVMDKQETAASVIGKWLEGGMCAAYMSEGLLKLVSYGDTSTAGNGCTWIAPQAFVVALDDTCFIAKDGEEPIKISRTPWQDAYNNVQVKWNNRQNQYASEITPDSDQTAINRYGLRIEEPVDWDFITTLTAATFAASMRVKRSVNIRNTYSFTLPFTYSYLEPMDIVTITTSSVWASGLNNVSLGIDNLPVRIQKIIDDPVVGLKVTAEDYPYGVGQPVLFNKQIGAGIPVQNAYELPGNTEAILFEAFSRLTGFSGNEIWIGACGTADTWGGTNIWVSADGEKYTEIGTIRTPARLGELFQPLAFGSDPDYDNEMVVEMVENSGPLEAGTELDADQGNTLCFVDGEIVAYSSCTVTQQNVFTMNLGAPSIPGYIRRGLMGSTAASHSAGGLFVRLDNTIFKYQYDPTWYGKTIYFKFASFNQFGNQTQDLSVLTAVPFTVPGLNPGTVDAGSGLVLVQPPPVTIKPLPIKPLPPIGIGRFGWDELIQAYTLTPLTFNPTTGYSGPYFTYNGTTVASYSDAAIGSNFGYAGGSFNGFGGATVSEFSHPVTTIGTDAHSYTAIVSITKNTSGGEGVLKFGIANGTLWIAGNDTCIGFYANESTGSITPTSHWFIIAKFYNAAFGSQIYGPVDTGVVIGSGQTLNFTISEDGTTIKFYVNGGQVGSTVTFAPPRAGDVTSLGTYTQYASTGFSGNLQLLAGTITLTF